MSTSASFPQHSGDHNSIVAASSTTNTFTLPVAARYVHHAWLPCRRVPGPPTLSSSVPSAAATSSGVPSSSQSGVSASATQSIVGPENTLTSPASAVSPASNSASPAAASASSSHPQVGKTETPLKAAQQFLASSGASLLYFANSSLSLAVRNTLAGGHTDTNSGGGGGAKELTEAAQDNLLSSSRAMAALKERFTTPSAMCNPASGNNNNPNSTSGIDWKKLAYVRQQCRYTGEALVTPPLSAHTDAAGSSISERHLPHTVTEDSAATEEKSVGGRFMQSLLHSFIPTTNSPATPVAGNDDHSDSSERNSATKIADGTSLTVPHGHGVMTYVLYAMPKPDYNPVAMSTSSSSMPMASKTAEKDAMQAAPHSSPFLPSSLIPTEFCPTLSELDANHSAASSAAEQPNPARQLLLSLVVYEGPFEQGQRHGRGRLTAYGRFVLECSWVHDVPYLAFPRQVPLSSSSLSSTNSSAVAAPTLRRIHAHVCDTASAAGRSNDSLFSSSGHAPLSWSLRINQTYMGSLALTALATRRLLTQLESSAPVVSSPPSSSKLVKIHGAHYVRLALPSLSSSSSTLSWDSTAAPSAFSGLSWVDHVVLLPDGLGEAHYYNEEDTSLRLRLFTVLPSSSVFHPPLWSPVSRRLLQPLQYHPLRHASMSSSTLASSLCTQYCGEWVSGLPHGFGVELERVTDPTCTPLALSSATAGAGPPQYPWRTLFLGQHVRGERCGPGTYHGFQGSEATEVIVCGTWPQVGMDKIAPSTSQQEPVNVVLLPPLPGRGRDFGASSFVTLQGTRWTEDNGEEFTGHGSSGGGTFPSATLRQSPVALSGMWEPLFRAVDEVVSQPQTPLLLNEFDGTDGFASTPCFSSGSVVWQHARRVMDHLTRSPECVSALRAFATCFAFMYGYDTAVAAGAASDTSAKRNETDDAQCTSSTNSSIGNTDGKTTEERSKCAGSSVFMKILLARLQAAAAAVPAAVDLSLGYPWCPLHSWCGIANLSITDSDAEGELFRCSNSPPLLMLKRCCYTGCLHEPLSKGATHRPTTSTHSAPRRQHRPPLAAVTAALEPHAAAHTFTHAMHAAAAMVSSLRLRLLSCFAAYPDLCEIVMAHNAHDDSIITYCWDLVYQSVGPILHEKATAVAVADVQMVWDLLGLDRMRPDDLQTDGDEKEGAVGVVTSLEVTVRPGWQSEGNETLRDYLVALRRCRALRESDFVGTSFLESRDEAVAEADDVPQRLTSLEACFRIPSEAAGSMTGNRDPTLQVFIGALQELHVLLHGAVASKSTDSEGKGVKEGARLALPEAAQPSFTPSRREALLRWFVLAASDPSSHPASAPSSLAVHIRKRQGHPFALLLIASYVLGGRITPQYPVCLPLGSDQTSKSVKPNDLLHLLKELGYAARQLLHTFPSIRAQTPAQPLAYPLDVLFARLEYVLSPCAMHYLLSYPSAGQATLNAPIQLLQPPQAEAALGAIAASAETSTTTKGVVVSVQLDQLPAELLQWCNENLTDNLTESILQRRLYSYWSRWTASTTPHLNLAVKEKEGSGSRGLPAPPSPLVCWVLRCLYNLFSTPVRQTAPRLSESTTSPLLPTPSSVENNVYTWKKFINAFSFTEEEKNEWAATVAANVATRVSPLSRNDYLYLVVLAYTLRELSGISLSFAAQFVLQDEDDDEDGEEVEGAASKCGQNIIGVSTEDSAKPPSRTSQLRSAEAPMDRKKNIFLRNSSSSLSSASSSLDSLVAASPVSLPPVETHETLVSAAASTAASSSSNDAENRESARAQTPTNPIGPNAHSLTPSPLSPQSVPSASLTARNASSPGGMGRVPRVKRGQSSLLRESSAAAAPLGKEWTLTVRVDQDAGALAAESQRGISSPKRGFANSLLWEVIDRVCNFVEHRMQEKADNNFWGKPSAPLQGSPKVNRGRR